MKDRYDNSISTASARARDAYVLGLDRFLGAEPGVEEALSEAIAEDPNLALAHVTLGRYRQVMGDRAGAQAAMEAARGCGRELSPREAGQVAIFDMLIAGKSAAGYEAARAQLREYPRDVLTAQACLGALGLIGFSGRAGREAENLALAEELAPAYGADWWHQGLLAFAQLETGQLDRAEGNITASLAGNSRNAHAAHIRSHLFYERGETDAGYGFITEWRQGYDRRAQMHCHISWHIALWALERGDVDEMWRIIDRDVDPRQSSGPPINVVSDLAAVLYRAEMAGVEVPQARWQVIADYTAAHFPKPGLGFADMHGALSYAMAGRPEALDRIIQGAKGPAADLVRDLAEAFGALAAQDWERADHLLTRSLADHARIGGSRAQRDLIEFASLMVLLRLGRKREARRQLAMHRPRIALRNSLAGM